MSRLDALLQLVAKARRHFEPQVRVGVNSGCINLRCTCGTITQALVEVWALLFILTTLPLSGYPLPLPTYRTNTNLTSSLSLLHCSPSC